jgi:hypothetical protein
MYSDWVCRGNVPDRHVSYTCARIINNVRTRYLNRDPQLLKLIEDLKDLEQMVPYELKKVA